MDAIVFAPLNKHSLRLGGLQHEDELRLLQERFGVPGFVREFNMTRALWTSRATSHVPIRDVAALITREGVCDAVRITDAARVHVPRPGPDRDEADGFRAGCHVAWQPAIGVTFASLPHRFAAPAD